MNSHVQTIAGLDKVIHQPARLMIVVLLYAVDQVDFPHLQDETGLNKGTLSSHLFRLKEEKYVKVLKTYRGNVPQTLVTLTRAGRKAFQQYRRKIKQAIELVRCP
jgi:DNA-binding MarR family transcriptional regulator